MTDSSQWLGLAFEPLAAWLQTSPGFVTESGDGWWFVGCDFVVPDHNCLVVTAGGAAGVAALDEGLSLLSGRPWPALVCVDDQAAPSLVDAVAERSLNSAGVLPHYWIELGDLIVAGRPDNAYYERVTEPLGFREVMGVFAAAFDRPMYDDLDGEFRPALLADPRLTFHLKRAIEGPASALVTWRGDEIVYVTVMGTHPAYQGRGLGRALVEKALLAERATGARFAHLVASDAGARLYRAVGFKLLANHPLWSFRPVL